MERTGSYTDSHAEVGRHRYRSTRREMLRHIGMRSVGLLLRSHKPHKPDHAVRTGAVQLEAPTLNSQLAHQHEQFDTPVDTTELNNESLVLGNRQPLMTDEQVHSRTGVWFGRLQAVVYPSGGAPRILCFDRTITVDGDRRAQYLMVTDAQLATIQRAEATNNDALRSTVKQQVISAKPGDRRIVGAQHPMPGKEVNPYQILGDDAGNPKDPRMAGEVEISVVPYGYENLWVADLGGGTGMKVQHSAEFITPQDPWPNAATPPPQFPQ